MRDVSFIEELMKTKIIMKVMLEKLEKGDVDVDIVEYSLATKMLESKLSILHALNIHIEGDGNIMTLNIKGSQKAIQIDLNKLREAITITNF